MADLSQLRNFMINEKANKTEEAKDWFLYDTMFSVVSATQTLRFFQQNGGTVGRALTNMTGNGQLPAGEVMAVTELVFSIFNVNGVPFTHTAGAVGATVSQINALTSAMFFDFRIEPSVEFQGHGRLLKDQVDTSSLAGGTETMALAGMSAKVLKLRTPLVLFPNTSFSLDMTITTPAAGGGYTAANTAFFWGLRGLKYRKK